MHTVSRDAELFFEILGDGPPVVLLHPFPVHHGFWMPVADLLASRYRLITPDLRGHGESTVGEGPATMEKLAADVARVCDAAGVGKAVLAGCSIGGYVLMEFWRRYPQRVAALVLCNTRAEADTEDKRAGRLKSADEVERHGTEAYFEGMVPKLIGETTRTNRPDLVAAARKMMRKMSVPGLAALLRGMAYRPDSVPTLKTVTVPTLILAGGEDVLTPVEDAKRMQQAIPGSRLEVIPNAGHYAVFEQPEAAGRIIRGFLDGLNIG
ncbi:MAG: alpha/beta fold hydrolase [Terriglobales bacterium]